ncbi:hypothetical protein BEK67_21105 [Ralstonia pickettii]|nr:hypothetical protein BEK67_21105 [Ralstonia pickettii]
MKTRFRVDGHLVECTSEPLVGTYFRVSWNLRQIDRPLSDEPLQTESYVCRATTEEEALGFVQTRSRLMSGLRLGTALTVERHELDAAAQATLNMPPDAPLVSGR